MFLAPLTGAVAFLVAGSASTALTQALNTSHGPSLEDGLFSMLVAVGTALGAVLPYLWLWRRAARRR
jgi:hypothetical protein